MVLIKTFLLQLLVSILLVGRSDASGKLQLFITSSGTRSIECVEIGADATVGDLVHEAGLSSSGTLSCGGETLSDMDKSLSEIGICPESTLQFNPPHVNVIIDTFYVKRNGGGLVLDRTFRSLTESDRTLEVPVDNHQSFDQLLVVIKDLFRQKYLGSGRVDWTQTLRNLRMRDLGMESVMEDMFVKVEQEVKELNDLGINIDQGDWDRLSMDVNSRTEEALYSGIRIKFV